MTWLSRDEAEALGIDVKHVALGVSDDRQPRSVTQPAVTNPAEPRIGISPVSRARRFAENYLEQLGTVAGETASFFENHYAANVLYYSKKVARPQIIAEKVKFGARWPKRSYQWRPADLNVSCADQGRTCTIEGLLAMTRSRNPHPA